MYYERKKRILFGTRLLKKKVWKYGCAFGCNRNKVNKAGLGIIFIYCSVTCFNFARSNIRGFSNWTYSLGLKFAAIQFVE